MPFCRNRVMNIFELHRRRRRHEFTSSAFSKPRRKGPGESDVLLRHWSDACARRLVFDLRRLKGVRTTKPVHQQAELCPPIKSVEIVFAPIRWLKRRGCQHHSDNLKRFCTHLLPTTPPSSKDLDCILINHLALFLLSPLSLLLLP